MEIRKAEAKITSEKAWLSRVALTPLRDRAVSQGGIVFGLSMTEMGDNFFANWASFLERGAVYYPVSVETRLDDGRLDTRVGW
jgi:hypothetical protein